MLIEIKVSKNKNVPTVLIDDKKIEMVRSTNFLGINIDDNLSWTEQKHHCKNKVVNGLYVLHISKNVLRQSHLKIVYHSLVHSHLTYDTDHCKFYKVKP